MPGFLPYSARAGGAGVGRRTTGIKSRDRPPGSQFGFDDVTGRSGVNIRANLSGKEKNVAALDQPVYVPDSFRVYRQAEARRPMSSRYHARSTKFWRSSTSRFANGHAGGPKLPWIPPHDDQGQAPASGHSAEARREHLDRLRARKIRGAKRPQRQAGVAIFPTTLRDRREGCSRPVCPGYHRRRRSDLNALHTIGRGPTHPRCLSLASASRSVHRLLRIGGRGSCQQLRGTRNVRLPCLANSLCRSLS